MTSKRSTCRRADGLSTARRHLLVAVLARHRVVVATLVPTSLVAGFLESLTLALMAEVAGVLVEHHSHMTTGIAGVHLSLSLTTALFVGLGLCTGRILLQVALSYLPARLTAKAQADLSYRLFRAFQRASWSVQSSEGLGELQELMTNQLNQAVGTVAQTATLVTNGLMLVTFLASALLVSWLQALAVVAFGIALFGLLRPLQAVGARQGSALSETQLDFAAHVHQAVRLTEEAQVFGVGQALERDVESRVQQVRHRLFLTQFVGRAVSGSYQSLVLLFLLGGLGVLIRGHVSNLSGLGAIVLLAVRASFYGQQTAGNYQAVLQSIPYLERIHDACRRYAAASQSRGSQRLGARPRIIVEHVFYAYRPGVLALEDVSFVVEPGEVVGVIGPSGAGKSTLVQVLLGLRRPTNGRYLLNGVPAEEVDPREWARAFAYVGQEPRLLHDSVQNNIRFHRDLTESDVIRAAQLAHIDREIESWPGRYEAVIGERSDAISGGQRQRICLARALAAEPDVIVLDEPTSALDVPSELAIQESLISLKGTVTMFIVAHRLSTLRICDRILVLSNGRVEAFGRPDEVVGRSSFYQAAVGGSRLAKAEAAP